MRIRSRQVAVNVHIVRSNAATSRGVQSYLSYLERDGVDRTGGPGRLYSTFADEADRKAFVARGRDDRHHFRVILSPEDGAAYEDLKPFTRDIMAQMESDLGTTLDWVASDHHDTAHPHVHVLLRGATEDGRILNIAGDYLLHGIRHRANEVLTRDFGPLMERELQPQNEIEAYRLTSLDRTLVERALDGSIDLRISGESIDSQRILNQQLIGRARQLESMKLATRTAPLRWSLLPDAEDVLRTMGERGDTIRTIHAVVSRSKLERAPQNYRIHEPNAEPVVGRIVACDKSDEESGRRHLILDGIDGRIYYADIGEASGSFPIGSVVRLSPRSAEPQRIDTAIAEITSAHDGSYNADIHLRHDPAAHIALVDSFTRRLEAMHHTGSVQRGHDGTWKIAPDYLEHARDSEERIARAKPFIVQSLSTIPLERQIGATGATWLDRQLIGEIKHQLAGYGFGSDVRDAILRRQQWLIQQGLAYRNGDDILFRRDILNVLTQRELRQTGARLQSAISKPYFEAMPGERIEGTLRQKVELISGRFALIEKSREFTLVPWQPVLDRHIGQAISGIPRDNTFEWAAGPRRGLSL
jgi:type IV secretory pathway VirD2 relaxase